MSTPLSKKLDDPSAVPYFLWDEPLTVADFRRRLESGSEPERVRLLAKLLREARDTDVWRFTTPRDVFRQLPKLRLHLGRRRAFWEFLLRRWHESGLIRRGDEAVLIDLVRDRVPQTVPHKPVVRGIRVDPPEEILANKLCALLARAEIRDLIDLRALESAGYPVESGIGPASAKDAGLTPGQLSWVLSQIELGPDLVPPGGVSRTELYEYLQNLIERLAHLSFPEGPPEGGPR